MRAVYLNRAIRQDPHQYIEGWKSFVREYQIKNVLILDTLALEEMLVLSQLGLKVYAEINSLYVSSLFKQELKRIRPLQELLEKADLILLPSDGSLSTVDIDSERRKLRKKGLIGYKFYNFNKIVEPPVLLQQTLLGTGFLTEIGQRHVFKTIITRKDTFYYTFERAELMPPSDIKTAIKLSGFKKSHVFDENAQPVDEVQSRIEYRFYQKAKVVDLPTDEGEDSTPLMTSGEISSRFNEIMESTNLRREDFEL